jgi:subtilisin family serine protease
VPLITLQVSFIFLNIALTACNSTEIPSTPVEPEIAQINTLLKSKIDTNRAIAGEVIVRFKPTAAKEVQTRLETRPSSLFGDGCLIGQRLNGAELRNSLSSLTELFDRYGVWAADVIDAENGAYRLKTAVNADLNALLTDFSERREVQYIEPNYPVNIARDPDDQFYRTGNQWGVLRINAPSAWDISTGGEDILIAILDTGVASAHPELSGKVQVGLNFTVEPANISTADDQGHGTFVAGIAAAKTNNAMGIAGVAWNAQILPVKVLSSSGSGSNATIAMGINFATERKANIINLSLGTEDRSQVVAEAVRKAYQAGIVLVAAVGNDGTDKPSYPASYDEVIAVSATTTQDRPAYFTNFGPEVAISAPGEGILSLTWAQRNSEIYAYDSGSSFSAPYVSGTVALMLSANKSLTNPQIRQILENTADIPPNALPTGTVTPLVRPNGNGSEFGILSPTAGQTQNITPNALNPSATPRPPTVTPTPIGLAFTPVASANPATAVGATQTVNPSATPSATATPFPGSPVFYDQKLGFGRLNAFRAVQAAQRAEVFSSRRATLNGLIKGLPAGGEALITLSPGDTRPADSKGNFAFNNLPPGIYRLSISIPKYGLPNDLYQITPYTFRIYGTEGETVQYELDLTKPVGDIIKTGPPLAPFDRLEKADDPRTQLFFPETGHTLSGVFRVYWENFGDLAVFGYPISEPFVEEGVTVQYFERMVLQTHPEFARTRFWVQPRLLGTYYTRNRQNEAPFKRVPSPNKEELEKETIYWWAETGHTLRGEFLQHWANNGGLLTFGYPISEPFVENNRLVQYFERYRLELHLELEGTDYIVLGTLMARNFAIERKYILP